MFTEHQDLSLSRSGIPAGRLRLFKRLGGDVVGMSDSHWPRGISHHNEHRTVGKAFFFEVLHCLRYWLGISLLVVSAGFYITCFLHPTYETVFFLTQEVLFFAFVLPILFHIPLWEWATGWEHTYQAGPTHHRMQELSLPFWWPEWDKCKSKSSQRRKVRLCPAHGIILTLPAESLLGALRRQLVWHWTTKCATIRGHQEVSLCLIRGATSDVTA